MHIVVCVKQVPDWDIPPSSFKVDEAAKKVVPPQGVAPVTSQFDAIAAEAAMRSHLANTVETLRTLTGARQLLLP